MYSLAVCRLTLVVLLWAGMTPGYGFENTSALASLASRYSPRWQEIQRELSAIDSQLSKLPAVPLRNYEGSPGYAHLISREGGDQKSTINIRWHEPHDIDLVALIPARNYGVTGLDPQFGLPDDFQLSLLDEQSQVLPPFAEEKNLSQDTIRAGHPLYYHLDSPVRAHGIRVEATRIPESPYGPGMAKVIALAEVFCFSGDTNVAKNARVSVTAPGKNGSLHLWRQRFLVDGAVPLGLPEIPQPQVQPWPEIGWSSKSHPTATSTAWVELDLGEAQRFDAISLFPALRPSINSIPGFGMPRTFEVLTSLTGQSGSWQTLVKVSPDTTTNIGHNPRLVDFPESEGQFIRIEATYLWKPIRNYPAFLAFSEIQVLSQGRNLAEGAEVKVSSQPEKTRAHEARYWSPASLTDGHGPEGKLISTREWLTLLDQRLSLERKRRQLVLEADALAASWQRKAIGILVLIAVLGAFLAIILPLHFRRSSLQRLRHIRQRLASDLHDDVGSNLGSIQLLSELARDHPGQERHLKSIQQIAAETVTSVRDIVWLLRPRADERVPAVTHLRETATILLSSHQWTLKSEFGEEKLHLSDEQQRDFSLFFREALHNIIRHAEANEVEILLRRTEADFTLDIFDNGKGIDDITSQQTIFLRSLKQRAIHLRGNLEVKTAPGEGTRLILTVPHPRKSTATP